MSSEMRELLAEMRAYDYTQGNPDSSDVGAWADRLERTLLARTEAGESAPVADGAVARLIRPAPLVSGTIQKFPTKTGATTVIPLEECLSLPPGEYLLYTHPQDGAVDLYGPLTGAQEASMRGACMTHLRTVEVEYPDTGKFIRDWLTHVESERNRLFDALRAHPQDASGDAERYRWLRDEASRAQLEMFADRRGTRLAADRVCDAGIDIAMQAKEAK